MGEPFGEASGRTFRPMGTYASNPYWNAPLVKSDGYPKTSNHPPSEALESGLPMSGYQLQGKQGTTSWSHYPLTA